MIYYPIYALVVLIYIVAMRLFMDRRSARREKNLRMSDFSDAQKIREVTDSRAADHFRNLFEVPILFYVICLAARFENVVSPTFLALAWAFVGLRYVQAYIHCTYNRVFHRALTYFAGCFVVLAMFIDFALTGR